MSAQRKTNKRTTFFFSFLPHAKNSNTTKKEYGFFSSSSCSIPSLCDSVATFPTKKRILVTQPATVAGHGREEQAAAATDGRRSGGDKVTAVVHGVRRGEQRQGSAEPWKIATMTGGRLIGSDYWINETLTRELYHQVMESLEHAMKRDAPILAEYLGGAINCDAYHIANPLSDGLVLSSCIQNSLRDAGVSVEEVNYINAHATSTVIGDLAEINALNKVFKNTAGIKMNATKSMIGHSMGAAGCMEAIAIIKAIQTGWLHPTINQFDLDPAVDFNIVANQKQQHEVNVAISNSFGLGGHNSVVVFSAFKP